MKTIIKRTLFFLVMSFALFFTSCQESTIPTPKKIETSIDNQYIIAEAEWLSESGGIIRFDNGFSILRNDTIYSEGEPKCLVINLNKHFNEMMTRDLKTNEIRKYISTRELLK